MIKPNIDEVMDTAWIKRTELADFLAEVQLRGGEVTPWFKHVSENFLPTWWKNLDNIQKFVDHKTIHKFC